MHELLHEIAICIVAAWVCGVAANFLKQPILLAYLVGGFLIGPKMLAWVHSEETIHTISELGLIFLLFMIGLEIDLKKIMRAGSAITVTGAVQIVGGTMIGIFVFKLLGFSMGGGRWDALYLAIAASLSSTVIIVKILYDKRELDTFPGRVTLGVLVLQDLFAILFLAVQPSLNNLQPMIIAESFGKVVLLVAAALAASRFVLPWIFHHIARLPELVLVGSLAWCFLLGEFGNWLKLSREMGALIAGVSLSTFPYALDVTAKVTSLRDFFVTLFFVALGMTIPMPTWPLILAALGFAAFVVASRWLTTFTPLYAMKQGLRASMLPSLNLSQVSEFSLVVLQLGVTAQHIPEETKGLVSFAFVILATLSAMGMVKSDGIVRAAVPFLKKLGLKDLDQEHAHGDAAHGEGGGHGPGRRIVILGFFRTASSLLEELKRADESLVGQLAVVDFSPVVRKGLVEREVPITYGDISQRDTLVHAGVPHAEILICTVPDSLLKGTSTEKLVRQLRQLAPQAKIFATTEQLSAVPDLYAAGANYVSIGRLFEARDLVEAVQAADAGLLEDKRSQLDERLKDRHEVLA
jgi:Kef-type K+ transport system membrane component KefB